VALFEKKIRSPSLQETNSLNQSQSTNYEKFTNSFGNELNHDQFLVIKEVAYTGRNLTKAMWEYLGIKNDKMTTKPLRIAVK